MTKTVPLALGNVVATTGVADWAKGDGVKWGALHSILSRHRTGDWGDLCAEDTASNDRATNPDDPTRILSSYTVEGRMVWIVTEWDRSVTTLLFPEEY